MIAIVAVLRLVHSREIESEIEREIFVLGIIVSKKIAKIGFVKKRQFIIKYVRKYVLCVDRFFGPVVIVCTNIVR